MKTIKHAVALLVLSASALPVGVATASDLADELSVVVTPRVIGGQEAQNNAWPSIAALVQNNSQSLFFRQFCGANQISERWVVTAAHCMYNAFGTAIDPSTIRVAVGFTDLANESDAKEIVVTNIIVHPQYSPGDPSSPHDLALVELATNSPQPSMALYRGDVDNNSGLDAVVAGWGSNDYSNPNQPLFPSRLNQVGVPIVSRAVCNSPNSYNGLIGEGQTCAGFPDGGKDSCVGDSGGPLMGIQNGVYRQIGVVSYGRGCAEANFYGVYTRLDHYTTWISEITSLEFPLDSSSSDNNSSTPVLINNSAVKSGGGASLGPLLPFFMMILAIWVLRRNMAANASESQQ